MTLVKKNRCIKMSLNKDTRWDRIRKRQSTSSSVSLKSDVIRRFINIDYIGQRNESILKGENIQGRQLNPVLVMNMRHQLFQQIPKKSALHAVKKDNIENCRAHNVAVEDHYIDNELKKYRQQLEKQYQRNKISKIMKSKADAFSIDNDDIVRSILTSSKRIEDFYSVPIEVLNQVNKMSQDFCEIIYQNKINANEKSLEILRTSNKNPFNIEHQLQEVMAPESNELSIGRISENLLNSSVSEQTYITETVTDVHLNTNNVEISPISPPCVHETLEVIPIAKSNITQSSSKNSAPILVMENEKNESCNRYVQFEDQVMVCNYAYENIQVTKSSDGIESVISDLAEKALKELEFEKGINSVQTIETVETSKCLEYKNSTEYLKITPMQMEQQNQTDVENILIVTRLNLSTANNYRDHIDFEPTSSEDESTVSSLEQNKIVEQLFQIRTNKDNGTLRKYFHKWVHFSTIEKLERENLASNNNRIKQINLFLDKIRKEKARPLRKYHVHKNSEAYEMEQTIGEDERDTTNEIDIKKTKFDTLHANKKFQKKIKIQQDIIDLQRLKLEKQERLIMQLKMNNVSKDATEARQEIKKELKAVLQTGDPKSKAKVKCLQIIGNLQDSDDEHSYDRLRGKALLIPKFLENMQERALERSIKHEQARQRRLQKEAEREAQKIAFEEAKRLEDEEAKRMRIEALKEKRRQEKIAKITKERERQHAIDNNRKAQEFYRRLLLRRIGMKGFKLLIQLKRDNQRKCDTLRRNIFKRNYFWAWRDFYFINRDQRIQSANLFHAMILKRRVMQAWQLYVDEERKKYQTAIDWYDYKVSEWALTEWHRHTKYMNAIEKSKLQKAKLHYEWHMRWKVLDCWQRLPQILRLERETEERRQRWRMKIWELLPDYVPLNKI